MSDTPETDSAINQIKVWQRIFLSETNDGITYESPIVTICRKLERERNEALAEVAKLRKDAQREAEHHDRMVGELEQLYDKNTKLRECHDLSEALCEKLERERDELKKDLEFRRDLFAVQENHLDEVRAERDEAKKVLFEIANSSNFDNIGNWARNKAEQALK